MWFNYWFMEYKSINNSQSSLIQDFIRLSFKVFCIECLLFKRLKWFYNDHTVNCLYLTIAFTNRWMLPSCDQMHIDFFFFNTFIDTMALMKIIAFDGMNWNQLLVHCHLSQTHQNVGYVELCWLADLSYKYFSLHILWPLSKKERI